MLSKSTTRKYLAIVGTTVLFPILYAIVNDWTIEPFSTICWAVVGFATGRDAVRMIWRWKGRQVTHAAAVATLPDPVGASGRPVAIALDEQEVTIAHAEPGSGMGRIPTLGQRLGFSYFDRYDGYESSSDLDPPASVH